MRYTPNLAPSRRESVVFRGIVGDGPVGTGLRLRLLGDPGRTATASFGTRPAARDSQDLAAEAIAAPGYETHFWSGRAMASCGPARPAGGRPPRTFTARRPAPPTSYALTANEAEFAAILDHLRRDPSARAYVQVAFTITHSPDTPVARAAVADFRRDVPAAVARHSGDDGGRPRWPRPTSRLHLRWQWDTRGSCGSWA